MITQATLYPAYWCCRLRGSYVIIVTLCGRECGNFLGAVSYVQDSVRLVKEYAEDIVLNVRLFPVFIS